MFEKIQWGLSGAEIERASFAIIDAEAPAHGFDIREWRVARRIIHAAGDFGVLAALAMRHRPVEAGLAALAAGAPVFCDSSMIRAGLSLARLRRVNPAFRAEDIHCHIGDPDVAEAAAGEGSTRALRAVEKARPILHGAVALVGNAPLALARLLRMAAEDGVRPALVIGVPVGFVNVVESKELLRDCGIPHVTIEGRRGGSALAVAALHGVLESAAGPSA